MFYASLIHGPYKGLCNTAFNACRPVYHWVYDMTGYWGDGVTLPREPLPDGVDYDHDRVISDLKKVRGRRHSTIPQSTGNLCLKQFNLDGW